MRVVSCQVGKPWLQILVLLVTVSVLGGCASAPRYLRKQTTAKPPARAIHTPSKTIDHATPSARVSKKQEPGQPAGVADSKVLAPSPETTAPTTENDWIAEDSVTVQTSLQTFVGEASYYAARFHGRKTASGERFSKYELTAAHRSLPFGTQLKITNLANQKKVVVRVNDRGPFKKGRVVDVSYKAAHLLDMIRAGVAQVVVEVLALP